MMGDGKILVGIAHRMRKIERLRGEIQQGL
jgi:hypothetical protein